MRATTMSRRFSDFSINDDVDVDGNRWETLNIHVDDTPSVLSMWHWRGTEINRFELKMIALHIQTNRQRSTPFSLCVKVWEIPACDQLVKVLNAKNQMIAKFYFIILPTHRAQCFASWKISTDIRNVFRRLSLTALETSPNIELAIVRSLLSSLKPMNNAT